MEAIEGLAKVIRVGASGSDAYAEPVAPADRCEPRAWRGLGAARKPMGSLAAACLCSLS